MNDAQNEAERMREGLARQQDHGRSGPGGAGGTNTPGNDAVGNEPAGNEDGKVGGAVTDIDDTAGTNSQG